MKILYCHNREHKLVEEFPSYEVLTVNPRGGTTVAMEVIPSWLLDTLAQGDTIIRKVGIARCSKDDNYNKKTGRELALSRMKTKTLTVINLATETILVEDEDDNIFEIKKSKDKDCAILVRILDD